MNEENFLEKRKTGELELQKKFDAWDKLGRHRHEHEKLEFKRLTAKLWRDPTIWAYAVLRDKQNKPLKLYPFQDKLINDRNRLRLTSSFSCKQRECDDYQFKRRPSDWNT